ncbi:MAG: hypothetical protein CUN55_14845 [Phototrophicales bacterium]|nr:MAG: hypothetical protein CUN55_14845 [Phototrophicales bacterium]
MKPILLLFLKAPIPGLVKTRLAAKIGHDEACAVYRELVAKQIGSIPEDWEVQIHYTGCTHVSQMSDWINVPAYTYHEQTNGGLGERLSHAFQMAFNHKGEQPVFAIGGDCPYLRRNILNNAQSLLDQADIVLGPASDGGYYLIGMNKFYPDCFKDISWSTEHVYEQTLEKIHAMELDYGILETLEDVDDIQSLRRAQSLRFLG